MTTNDWRAESETLRAALIALLAELKLSTSSTFVPQSQSRNAKDKQPSLNWRVVVKRDGRTLIETDYMQGIAHVPGYRDQRNAFDRRAYTDASEKGTYPRGAGNWTRAAIPQPSAVDIMYSLVSDAQCGDNTFADFCVEFGYDSDSRKAEATWRACVDTFLVLRRHLGDHNYARLSDAYREY